MGVKQSGTFIKQSANSTQNEAVYQLYHSDSDLFRTSYYTSLICRTCSEQQLIFTRIRPGCLRLAITCACAGRKHMKKVFYRSQTSKVSKLTLMHFPFSVEHSKTLKSVTCCNMIQRNQIQNLFKKVGQYFLLLLL